MSDGIFHSARDIANLPGLEPGQWYRAISELIEAGHTFERDGNSLLLCIDKRPNPRKPADELAKLLAGIDASRPEHPPRRRVPVGERPVVMTYEPGADDLVPEKEPYVPGEDILLVTHDGGVRIPAKASVTATRGILAKKSSGKTYLAMVIAEEFLRFWTETGTPMPFAVVDPTGVWYGLSATTEGLPSPHDVLRLGGKHGQLPLAPEDGERAARVVVELWPQCVIFDVSDMLPEEQHGFFADFGNHLYTICTKPLHLFVDEADEFIPQSPEPGNKNQRRSLGVGDRLVRRARVKGIGVTLITQRPAVINKNALSQVDGLYVLSVTGPHDLDAIDTWMKPAVTSPADRNLVREALPTLKQGEAFFMQAHLRAGSLVRFATREKTTFDSSRTPTVDEPEPPVPELSGAPDDVVMKAAKILEVEPPLRKQQAAAPALRAEEDDIEFPGPDGERVGDENASLDGAVEDGDFPEHNGDE